MNGPAALAGTRPGDAAKAHPVPAAVWLGAIAVILLYLAWENFPSAHANNARDWEFFYPAAEALLQGTDLYESGEEDGYIYPPLLAFLLMPLVQFGFFGSAQIWLVLSVAALIVALTLTVREIGARIGPDWRPARLSGAVCIALLLSINFSRRELQHTQTDWVTVLGFVLGLMWMDRRPLLAGAALGIAANLKYHTLIVVPYFLLRGRFKAAGATVVAAMGAALLPALQTGWSLNLEYLARAFGGLAQFVGIDVPRRANVWEISNLDSISVSSALSRASESLGHGTGLTVALVAAAAGACVALGWWMYRLHAVPFWPVLVSDREREQSRGPLITAAEWMGLIVATIAFSPQTLKRHMFVIVPVYAMVAVMLLARPLACGPGEPSPRYGRGKLPLLLGLIASTLMLLFPLRSQSNEASSDAWRAVGGPCWGLLVLFFALLWTALAWDRASQSAAPSPAASK